MADATENSDKKTAWRDQLQSRLDDLKGLGNEIKDRIEAAGHTAQTEASEAWRKLEPQLGNAERKFVAATDDAVDELRAMFGQLGGKLSELRDKLK